MNKKYQIFISSTYTDLIEERGKLQDTILSMSHFPVGMELFSAADEKQWSIIQKTIDTSDYYVLIIGNKYGTVIEEGDDKGISYTEKEYHYAEQRGIPILAFLVSDKARRTVDQIEADPVKIQRLRLFIQDVKSKRMVEWWDNSDDLALKVSRALHKQFEYGVQPGWVRADAVNQNIYKFQDLKERFSTLEKENLKLMNDIQTIQLENLRVKNNFKKMMGFFSELDSRELDYVYRNPKRIQKSNRHVFNVALHYGYCDEIGITTQELRDLLKIARQN